MLMTALPLTEDVVAPMPRASWSADHGAADTIRRGTIPAPVPGGFFQTLLLSLTPADRAWVQETILRYATINDRPDSPKPRL